MTRYLQMLAWAVDSANELNRGSTQYHPATITHLVQWHGQLAYLHSAYELKRINA